MNIRRVAVLLAAAVLVLRSVGALFAQSPTTFHYYYDDAGQLSKVTDSTGTQIQYTYDLSGNITQVTRTTTPEPMSIINVTPSNLIAGSTVTIAGQNFSATAAGDTVKIGGVTAMVISATATQLVVQVPSGTVGSAVSVTVGGVTATFNQTSQTITFGPLSNVTYGVSPFAINATASSGLAVSFASTTTGVCTVAGNLVSIAAAGTCSITASQAGNVVYAVATAVTQSFTVNQASQTITFAPINNMVPNALPFTVSATASSGLAVSFASTTSTVCTVAGTTVTIVGNGTCSITASQAGNVDYTAATPVTRSFTVGVLSQTISFDAIPNQILGISPFEIAVQSSSGLAINFSSTTPTVCKHASGL